MSWGCLDMFGLSWRFHSASVWLFIDLSAWRAQKESNAPGGPNCPNLCWQMVISMWYLWCPSTLSLCYIVLHAARGETNISETLINLDKNSHLHTSLSKSFKNSKKHSGTRSLAQLMVAPKQCLTSMLKQAPLLKSVQMKSLGAFLRRQTWTFWYALKVGSTPIRIVGRLSIDSSDLSSYIIILMQKSTLKKIHANLQYKHI